MKLVLTDEQEDLRAATRRLLTDHAPMPRVREIAVDGGDYDRDLWRRLAGLGLTGLIVDERHGGGSAGHVELCVVLEELGRALAPVPFVAGPVLAATALRAAGGVAADELLPRVASGAAIVTVAVPEAAGSGTVHATRDGDRLRLDGTIGPVLDGQHADQVIVATDTGLALLDSDPPGLTRTPLTSTDPTRGFARLDLAGVRARPLDGDDPAAVRRRIADTGALALAAEQVGGMTRCLDMTVEYAKIRMQFGRPIGSFQAVKHACADLYSEIEQATAALRYAAWAADEDPAAFGVAASLAKAACSQAYSHVAAQTIQLHGGIGFTWEHDAHLYAKRARGTAALFGDPAHHRELLAQRLSL